MADLIGQLGLDTAAIERALDNVSKKLSNAAINAEGLNLAITASGAAIAIWAKNFVDASQKADALDKAIKGVAKSLSSSEFTGESALETRLKEVDSLLTQLSSKQNLSDVVIQEAKDLFTGRDTDKDRDQAVDMALKKRAEIEESLAQKVRDRTKLMELEKNGMNELAEIEKIRLEYAEKRGKAHADNNAPLVEALKRQEEMAIAVITERREREHKNRMEFQAQEDTREFDKQIAEDRAQFDKDKSEARKKADEEVKAARDEEKEDNEHLLEQHQKANELAARKLELMKETAIENNKITEELAAQNTIADIQNPLEQERAGTAHEFDKQIAEQEARGNAEGANELRVAREREMGDRMADLARQTPADRRAIRRERQLRDSDIRKQEGRDRDLERRRQQHVMQGTDPDKLPEDIKDLERRRLQEARDNLGIEKAKEVGKEQRAWSETDSNNLQKCAEALSVTDG